MGVDQLEGVLHGIAANTQQQQAQAEISRSQAMADWYRQRIQESAGEGEAASQFASAYLAGEPGAGGGNGPAFSAAPGNQPDLSGVTMPPPLQGIGGPSPLLSFGQQGTAPANGGVPGGLDRVMGAMQSMARANPRMAGMMLNKILPDILGTAVAGKAAFFHPGDQPQTFGNWQRIATGPNTSQLVYNDPSGGQLTAQTDDDGNLVGWSQNDAKGRSRFIPYKGSAVVKQAVDQDGNVIPNHYITEEGKPVDTRTIFQRNGYDFVQQADGSIKLQPIAAPKAKEAPSAAKVTTDTFDDEGAARKAGYKNGDIVTLKGVGKVRLK
jgi:hypothetical protein